LTVSVSKLPLDCAVVAPAKTAMPSFVEVYRTHAPFVWRVLRRLASSEHEAEDAMQEVFVIVNQKLGSFEGRSKMTTWLYGICFRVVSDRRRRASVRNERLASNDAVFDGAAPNDVFEEVASREGNGVLARILDKMSLEQRAVFVLFELDGYESEEIAELVGCPVGTVYSRLHMARDTFKKEADRWRRTNLEPRDLPSSTKRAT